MSKLFSTLLASVAMIGAASSAHAVIVSWTDWQSETSTTGFGQITHNGQTIDVNFSGSGASVGTGGSSDYWREGTPPAYTSGIVENAPTNDEIITLATVGTRTITFSQAVVDPYIAFLSWNDQTTTFSGEIELISEGEGWLGSGVFNLNGDGTGFSPVGEFHGVVRLKGTYTSFSFTDANHEFWHGFTVGIGGLPGDPVEPVETPEPAAIGLLGLGLAGAARLRRRKAA